MSLRGILVHVKLMLEIDKTAAIAVAMVELIVASSCGTSCLFIHKGS